MIRWRTRRRTTKTVRRPIVLCYHAVSPTWEHRLSIHPDLLLRQVQALGRFRRVHVAFDDAFRSAITVFPKLERMGVPIQVFVCTAYAPEGAPLTIRELETRNPEDLAELATLTWDELRALTEQRIAVGSHAVSHPHLPRLSDAELRRELSESKEELETELGRACTDLAYPYGEHDERVRAAARAAGYKRAFALWGGPHHDPYAAPRLDLYRRHSPARALLMTTPLHRLVA